MLSSWLQRGGIGQILAPDPIAAAREDEEEEVPAYTGGVWNIVAPDSNFTTTVPLKDGTIKDEIVEFTSSTDNKNNDKIISSPTYTTPTKQQQQQLQQLQQLSTPGTANTNTQQDEVEKQVLSAAKALTLSMTSPPLKWEGDKQFFSYCASSNQLNEKKLKKVRKLLKKDYQLSNARASKMANLVPDGFTPLHACAYAGNSQVAQLIMEICPESVDARDIQGRTPLHIASEQGHLEIVKLIKQTMTERDPTNQPPVGPCAPTDLAGRTPLGWAATSREKMARKHREELHHELFSPGDVSVYGVQTPASVRSGGAFLDSNPLNLKFGFAEMPGMRIDMEDAICHSYPLSLPLRTITDPNVGFFGVFDGHGDGGVASRYVADSIVQCLLTNTEQVNNETTTNEQEDMNTTNIISKSLISACKDVDVDLRAIVNDKNIQDGGSTGVMAIVTNCDIIVGNVGDSRCIAVQTNKEDASVTVTALSTDHTPGLEKEKERIVKAGLEVISETFPDPHKKGEETTLFKIQKSENDKIAVARAFGDFDYKANDTLAAEEQAIICIPEIQVYPKAKVDYLILACDGVFDVMSNDEVGEFVVGKVADMSSGDSLDCEVLPAVGDDLLKHCLDKGSTDNMSVMIVAFNSRLSSSEVKDDAQRVLEFTAED